MPLLQHSAIKSGCSPTCEGLWWHGVRPAFSVGVFYNLHNLPARDQPEGLKLCPALLLGTSYTLHLAGVGNQGLSSHLKRTPILLHFKIGWLFPG